MENKAKRNAGEPIYRTGSAKLLHGLIPGGYFKKPRTSKEAFLKLNPDIKAGALTEAHKKEIAKITATLSQGKFPNS